MVDPVLVSAKLQDLEDHLARVRTALPAEAPSLAGNRDALDVVAFNVQQAIQACLDISSHLISDEGWGAADTLRESILRLGEQGVVSREVAADVAAAVSVRNLIVHGYSHVDPVHFHRDVVAGLPGLDRFGAEVARWVAARRGT